MRSFARFRRLYAMVTGALVLGIFTEISHADLWMRSNDPFRWSQQTNAKGIDAACRSYLNEYNAVVGLYNAQASNSQKRIQFRQQLSDIKQQMRKYGCSKQPPQPAQNQQNQRLCEQLGTCGGG